MSKNVLLVTDNPVLGELYQINLSTYVGLNVELVQDHPGALQKLEGSPDYVLIIAQGTIGGQDAGALIYQGLIEQEIDTPLLVVGTEGDLPEEVQRVENPQDIKSLLSLVGKSLGVTAKEMASLKVPEFYPFSIRLFLGLGTLPCDVFFKTDNQYQLIKKKNDTVWPEIKNFLENDISILYVPAVDRLKLLNQATQSILKSLEEKDLAPAQLSEKIEQGMEAISAEIFANEKVSAQVVELSHKCMNAMRDVVKEAPNLRSLILLLTRNRSGFLYLHSMLAGYVCDHILNKMSWSSEAHIDKLKFVLFFHDLYLAPIYEKYLDIHYEDKLILDPRLTEAEKEVVLRHAQKASETIAQFPRAPLGVDVIIRQHHGTTNGEGFATVYKDDISPLSKVLIIGEAFSEEVLIRLKERPSENIPKAEILTALLGRFRKHTYKKLIKTLEDIEL